MAALALGRLLETTAPEKSSFEGLVLKTIHQLLDTQIAHTLKKDLAQGGALFFRDGVQGDANSPIAHAVDNIYAYFALEQAALVFGAAEDSGLAKRFLTLKDALKTGLTEHLWHAEENRPRAFFPAVADAWGDESPSHVASWYALFATAIRDPYQAEQALQFAALHLDLGAAIHMHSNSPLPVLDDLESTAVLALARRSAAAFDPRLDDLARLDIARLDKDKPTAPLVLFKAAIAHRPGGMFGAFGDLDRDQPPKAPPLTDIDGGRFQHFLDQSYAETLGTLLASEPEAHVFDHQFTRMVYLRSLREHVTRGLHPETWFFTQPPTLFQDESRQTAKRLLAACQEAPRIRQALRVYTGLDCPHLAQAFRRALRARGIDPETLDGMVALFVGHHGPDARILLKALHKEIQSYATPQVQNPALHLGRQDPFVQEPALSTWNVLRKMPVTAFNTPATTRDLRDSIRMRLQQAVKKALSGQQGRFYALDDLDLISVFHPESSHYWSRAALEFRTLQDSALSVQYWLRGGPSRAPSTPPTPELKENRRALRQLINRVGDGDLVTLSTQTGMPADVLHAMLKTGVISRASLEALLLPYPLDSVTSDALRSAFWLSAENSAYSEEDPPLLVPRFGTFSYLGGLAWGTGLLQALREVGRYFPTLVPTLMPEPSEQNVEDTVSSLAPPSDIDPCGVGKAGFTDPDLGWTALCVRAADKHGPDLSWSSAIPTLDSVQEALDKLWWYSPFSPALILKEDALERGTVHPHLRPGLLGDHIVDMVVLPDDELGASRTGGHPPLPVPDLANMMVFESSEMRAAAEHNALGGYLCSHDERLFDLENWDASKFIDHWLKQDRDLFYLKWGQAGADKTAIGLYRDFAPVLSARKWKHPPKSFIRPPKPLSLFPYRLRPLPGVRLYCVSLADLKREKKALHRGMLRTLFTIEPTLIDDPIVRAQVKETGRLFKGKKLFLTLRLPYSLVRNPHDSLGQAYVTVFKMRKSQLGIREPRDRISQVVAIKDGSVFEIDFVKEPSRLGKKAKAFWEDREPGEDFFVAVAFDIATTDSLPDAYAGSLAGPPVQLRLDHGLTPNKDPRAFGKTALALVTPADLLEKSRSLSPTLATYEPKANDADLHEPEVGSEAWETAIHELRAYSNDLFALTRALRDQYQASWWDISRVLSSEIRESTNLDVETLLMVRELNDIEDEIDWLGHNTVPESPSWLRKQAEGLSPLREHLAARTTTIATLWERAAFLDEALQRRLEYTSLKGLETAYWLPELEEHESLSEDDQNPDLGPNAPPELVELRASEEFLRFGKAVYLVATAEDPDKDPLFYEWTTGCTAGDLSLADQARAVFRPVNSEPCTFKVTVRDSRGAQVQDTLTISVPRCALPANSLIKGRKPGKALKTCRGGWSRSFSKKVSTTTCIKSHEVAPARTGSSWFRSQPRTTRPSTWPLKTSTHPTSTEADGATSSFRRRAKSRGFLEASSSLRPTPQNPGSPNSPKASSTFGRAMAKI